MAVVGDNPEAQLREAASGKLVAELAGHADFSFAVAWHPAGHLLATGNQVGPALPWGKFSLNLSLPWSRVWDNRVSDHGSARSEKLKSMDGSPGPGSSESHLLGEAGMLDSTMLAGNDHAAAGYT